MNKLLWVGALIVFVLVAIGVWWYQKPLTSGVPATITLSDIEKQVHFDRGYIPESSGDWLLISADENIEGSQLKGWSVRSAVSGKQFFLKDLSALTIGPAEWSVFVHTGMSPDGSDRAMEGEKHMYFNEPDMAWGAEHDTIELLNSEGVVVDTITY